MPEEKHPQNPIQNEASTREDGEGPRRPKSFKEGLVDFYYNAVPFFNANLAWAVMSLPLVTFFPALGGLYAASLELAQGNVADWGTVWSGFKEHGWLSLRWGLLVLFGDIILLANIWFYFNIDQGWAIFALVACIFLLIFWMAVNQFSFPLLLLQEEKKIFLAIRNGYVVVMRRPLAAVKVMLLNLLITGVSILLPPLWIFISMSLICTLQSREVLKAVDKIRQKDARRDAIQAHREGEEETLSELEKPESEDGEN
jgi:uncharacterized membrane protein YesL